MNHESEKIELVLSTKENNEYFSEYMTETNENADVKTKNFGMEMPGEMQSATLKPVALMSKHATK